jgi:hypothetical protein
LPGPFVPIDAINDEPSLHRFEAGDGFVASFASPSGAIACADEIVDAVRVLGIEARVGIHAGEVLVSPTVRDIATGSRRTFADRGKRDLKGVPGRWRVYALEALCPRFYGTTPGWPGLPAPEPEPNVPVAPGWPGPLRVPWPPSPRTPGEPPTAPRAHDFRVFRNLAECGPVGRLAGAAGLSWLSWLSRLAWLAWLAWLSWLSWGSVGAGCAALASGTTGARLTALAGGAAATAVAAPAPGAALAACAVGGHTTCSGFAG